MKKENITGFYFPVLLFMLGLFGSIYSNELKQIINTMNLQQYFSTLCLVLAAISISYSLYVRNKKKITALKDFRDKEMVRVINHFNAQLKTMEDRITFLNNKVQAYPSNSDTDPQLLLHETENNKQKESEIIEYNSAFKDWGIGNYGLGEYTSIYKQKDFKQ